MDLLRPDDPEIVGGSDTVFDREVEGVIAGVAVVVVGDSGGRGVDVTEGKAHRQQKHKHSLHSKTNLLNISIISLDHTHSSKLTFPHKTNNHSLKLKEGALGSDLIP